MNSKSLRTGFNIYNKKRKHLHFFMIFSNDPSKQTMKLPCDNVKILMNGVQSKPLVWGHVTRPRPIRGRGNSDESASRAPRPETGRSQLPGRGRDCRSRPRARLQPGQSPVTPAEKPELGQASALCYRLGCKISLFWNFIVQIVGNVNRVTWEKTKTEEKWLIDVRILEFFLVTNCEQSFCVQFYDLNTKNAVAGGENFAWNWDPWYSEYSGADSWEWPRVGLILSSSLNLSSSLCHLSITSSLTIALLKIAPLHLLTVLKL